MQKPKLSRRIKIAFLRIMEALGAAASNLASNAKMRVAEINLEARRHEILTEFSLQALDLWRNGEQLPKELSDMFVELSGIDDKLSILRAQKYAKVKIEADADAVEGKAALPAKDETEAPVCAASAEKAAAPEPPDKAPAAVRKTAKPKPKE